MFQDRTTYDLLVEYFADYYETMPLEAHRNADGHVQFKDTGDEFIDRWEELIAAGKTPDFSEAFSAADKAKIKRLREKGSKRVRIGGSFKAVVEDMERQARLEGALRPTGRGLVTVSRQGRSNFGDGS